MRDDALVGLPLPAFRHVGVMLVCFWGCAAVRSAVLPPVRAGSEIRARCEWNESEHILVPVLDYFEAGNP
eukprot:scaffold21246_cov110-Isochrysis_galbana.AAC.1